MKEDKFRAAREFLNWMNAHYPGSKNAILRRANIPISKSYLEGLEPGLGQFPSFPVLPGPTAPPTLPQAYGSGILQSTLPQPEPAWWEKLANTAAPIVKGYLSYKQQDKITDLQIERMKRGLPPIEDPGRYMAPTVQISHTVDPSAIRQAMKLDEETKQMLWMGGGLLAVIAVMYLANR